MIGHLTTFDAFRVSRDLETWFKIHTNVSANLETASPKTMETLKMMYQFGPVCDNCKILLHLLFATDFFGCQGRWQKLMFSEAAPRPRLVPTSLAPQAPLGGVSPGTFVSAFVLYAWLLFAGSFLRIFAPPSLSCFLCSFSSYSTGFHRCDSVQRASLWQRFP